MTTSFVPAVVPPETRRDSLRHPALPLPRLAPAAAPDAVRTVYCLAKIDAGGRAAAAPVEQALGWAPGDRLNFQESGGLILITPHPRGVFEMSAQGHVRLPVTVRRWCSLVPGDRVLLVADASRDLLVVYPPITLEALIAESCALLLGGESA